MPLMSPEIQRVIRAATAAPGSEDTEKSKITDLLDRAGLGLEDTLENLAFIAKNTDNDSLKVRVNESVLKMHGVLKEKDQTPAMPSFTIIINDPYAAVGNANAGPGDFNPTQVNPILIPRQMTSPKVVDISGAV